MDPIDYAYDVLQGVSIGGLNSAFIATYERGNEVEALDNLEKLWLANPINSFWENWSLLGPLESIWRKSIIDN